MSLIGESEGSPRWLFFAVRESLVGPPLHLPQRGNIPAIEAIADTDHPPGGVLAVRNRYRLISMPRVAKVVWLMALSTAE
jgi:hypothetical protein